MRALITGASGGIGREIAKELDSKGIQTVLVARNEKQLLETKKMLKEKSEIYVADLSNYDKCIELHNNVKNIDILVNNAGFGTFGNFTQTNLNEEIKMINTNITALHILTKLYLKDMKKKNTGYILNVGSIASFLPGPLMATYYSTKAYVLRLTEAIYQELKKEKSEVKISVLCPGPTQTNFLEKAGVCFKTKSARVEDVAKLAVNKMFKGKLIIVPGIKIKIARFLSKIVPDKIIAKFTYNVQVKRG